MVLVQSWVISRYNAGGILASLYRTPTVVSGETLEEALALSYIYVCQPRSPDYLIDTFGTKIPPFPHFNRLASDILDAHN